MLPQDWCLYSKFDGSQAVLLERKLACFGLGQTAYAALSSAVLFSPEEPTVYLKAEEAFVMYVFMFYIGVTRPKRVRHSHAVGGEEVSKASVGASAAHILGTEASSGVLMWFLC